MSYNRRDFLRLAGSSFIYVLSAQIFFGEKVSAEKIRSFSKSELLKLILEMPVFDGVFLIDSKTTEEFAVDWGYAVRLVPMGMFRPGSQQDIVKMVHFCQEKQIKVTMRGIGGAAYGQTQLEGGIIIDSTSLKKISWLEGGRIEVAPGLIWREVLDFAKARGRTVAVLPDTVVTSVGGTANVGGIGETSYNFGSVVDQIVEFDLVTAGGAMVTCSDSQNSELFQRCLGSMGQFGFMSRIVLKTMAAPELVYTRQFKYSGTDYAAYLNDLVVFMTSEPMGAVGGHLVRNAEGDTFSYVLDITHWSCAEPKWLSAMSVRQIGETKTWSFFEYAHRNTAAWDKAVQSGATAVPHPYFSFFVPFNRTQEMADYLQKTPMANRGAARIMLSPMKKSSFRNTTFVLPQSELLSHFRIYRIIKSGEMGSEHREVLQFNQNVLILKVQEMEGKVYLPFSPVLSMQEQLHHFGAKRYRNLARLKAEKDSDRILNSGAGLFL